MTLRKHLIHFLSAEFLMGIMAASGYAHSSSAHVHRSPALARVGSGNLVSQLHEHGDVTTIDAAKASRLREKTSPRPESVRTSLAPMNAFDEPVLEGSGCVREGCACDATTHGDPWCYSKTRGDCPNHQGLLCVWSD